jgi:DNA-binding NarL/FixJ family response regulator
VLDFALPDLNAVQVIQRLLEPGREFDAEVLVVTGGIRDDVRRQLETVGVKTIVSKADGISVVIDAMRQALARRKAA